MAGTVDTAADPDGPAADQASPVIFAWMGEFRATIWWLMAYVFMSAVDGSVVNPSIALYMQELDPSVSDTIVGLGVALFPMGMLFGVLIVLPLAARHQNATLSATLIVLTVANLGYALGGSNTTVMVSRFVAGFASAGALYTFKLGGKLLESGGKDSVTRVDSLSRAVSTAGQVIGPCLALGFTSVSYRNGRWHIDEYTLPGIFTAIVFLGIFVAQRIVQLAVPTPPKADLADDMGEQLLPKPPPPPAPPLGALLSCIAVTSVAQFAMMSFVAFNAQITSEHFGWSVMGNALMFSGIGAMQACVAMIAVFKPELDARYISVVALIAQIVAFLLMLHYPGWELSLVSYVCGACLLGACYPLLNNAAMTLFKQLYVKPSDAPIGPFICAMVFSRAAGPFVTGLVINQHTNLPILINLGGTAIALLSLAICWSDIRFTTTAQADQAPPKPEPGYNPTSVLDRGSLTPRRTIGAGRMGTGHMSTGGSGHMSTGGSGGSEGSGGSDDAARPLVKSGFPPLIPFEPPVLIPFEPRVLIPFEPPVIDVSVHTVRSVHPVPSAHTFHPVHPDVL